MSKISFGELVNSGVTPLPKTKVDAPAREISFAEIVCPARRSFEESEFARHFRAKQMLHISADDPTRFEHLFDWRTINNILSLNLLPETEIRVTRDGRDIPPSLYRTSDGRVSLVDSRKLHELVKQNASVAINFVQFLSPSVRRLANQIEITLGQKVWVNCYMTFGAGGAFATHFDAHDVIVLQLQGSKRWFLYDEPEPAPLENTPKVKPAPAREVAFETDLQAGDVLYVPRGTYHRAAVTDTDSVHLTFGIRSFKGVKFVDAIRSAAERDRFFREDILMLGGKDEFANQERELKARLCQMINNTPLLETIEQWQLAREPVYRFHLGPREDLDDATMVAPLLRSPHAWRDTVRKRGKEPSAAGEAIVQLLMERSLATVGELKAELGTVLDEDTISSTLAELLDDCWIEVVHDTGGGSSNG